MDKYEMNLKMEQIKKLAAKKAYKEAAAIANEINWVKVKDWSILATVINVQEAVGDYEEARDAAIIAYNRNLGGKKLVYKLTQLLIKLQQFDEADELYDEYDRMAYRDADRYVLFYELRKAEGANDPELISILEEYKEQEADEKYLYELAKLYAKHDRKDECIKLCDDIIMWFQDGEYVENAIKLKQKLGGALTKMQQKIKVESEKRKNDAEETKQRLFQKQKEIMRSKSDELEEALEEDEKEQTMDSDGISVPPMFSQSEDISITTVMDAFLGDDESEDEEDDTFKKILAEDKSATEGEDIFVDAGDRSLDEDVADAEDEEDDDEPDIQEKMSQIPDNIKSMINEAKKQIDDKYDRINKEEEAERIAKEINVPSYGNNIYDTQNIQEALAKNFSEYIDEEDDLVGLRPSPKKVEPKVVVTRQPVEEEEDDQIEGQMNIAEWLANVREEKYGKQNTKKYSRTDVVRFLEDTAEKSAAYDKIIEEQKAAKAAAKAAESGIESQLKARTQMMLHAAKTDLAIRTGKATLKLEEAVANLKEAAAASKNISIKVEEPAPVTETVDVDTVVKQGDVRDEQIVKSQEEAAVQAAKPEVPTEITLETATFEPVADEVIAADRDERARAKAAQEEAAISQDEEIDFAEDEAEVTAKDPKQEAKQKKVSKLKLANPVLKGQVVVKDGEKKLAGDLAKLFRKYREMPGIEAQLIEFFESINEEMHEKTSATGNLIISGNSSSDKIDLARTIVRAINFLYPEKTKKIAKTTGDSINSRGIEKAMPKLMGTALIVEEAGSIQPKRVKEILSCLSQDTDGMIVIFEDSDSEMNVLINFNPELVTAFNHRIVLKQYTVNELVEIARKYANKKQYEIDDDALLALYLKIDSLHNMNENIRLDDVKEIINKAIENASQRSTKRKFTLMKRTQSSVNYIYAQDLKD